jgi:hypothetical protein
MLQANPAESDPRPHIRRSFEVISPRRVELWREELEPWQVSVIEAVVGDRMKDFGYQPEAGSAGASDMVRASLEAAVEVAFQKLFRSPSAFYHFFQPTNMADEEKWTERASAMYQRVRLRHARTHSQADLSK